MLKQFASLGVLMLVILVSSARGSSQAPSRAGSVTWTPPLSPPGLVFVVDGETTHMVKSGETLWGIARQYGVDFDALAKLNNRESDPSIRIGDELELPGKSGGTKPKNDSSSPFTKYSVSSGETLYRIAKDHGVTVSSLMSANGIEDPGALRAGQTLIIPGAGRQPAQAPAPKSAPSPPPVKKPASDPPARPASDTPIRRSVPPVSPSSDPVLSSDAPAQPVRTETVPDAQRPRAPLNHTVHATPRGETSPLPGTFSQPLPTVPSVSEPDPGSIGNTPRPPVPRQTTVIPHIVAPNDTLEKLAKRFGTTVDQIRLENPGIHSNRDLRVGNNLKIRVQHSFRRAPAKIE